MERGPPDDGGPEAAWAEASRRHQAIRRLLARHRGRLAAGDVTAVARDLGVSRATLYRLIRVYRECGSVDALLPRRAGRRRGARILPDGTEEIIRQAIQQAIREAQPARRRPSLSRIVEQVHARCGESSLPPPHRRTIRARLAAAAKRVPAESAAVEGERSSPIHGAADPLRTEAAW